MNRVVVSFVVVMCGGALGTALRALVAELADAQGLSPWVHLLIVNIAGAFVLGWFAQRTFGRSSGTLSLLVGVGFLGSLTTFSGFTVEFVQGVRDGRAVGSAALVILLVLAGVIAAVSGRLVGSR